MNELINNVLDLTRSRLGGGIPLRIENGQPIEPVLTQVIEELRIVHPERRIEVNFAITDPVERDHGRIGQLLSNLLGNAITHGREDQTVQIEASTRSGEFSLSVTNGGEPISPATMARLFQPFYRAEGRSYSQGLGLGLYIASEIAKAHGGTLVVTSDCDGTRFTFTMPLNQAEI